MARETLPVALDLMFGHEGGYVNAKTDRGGPTKYGVTHKTLAAHRGVASVTAEQVKEMTREEATEIYRRSYWTQSGGDLLPKGLDYAAFDFGVGSGPATAVRRLQKVLGVREDGVVGEQTVAAAKAYPGGIAKLIHAYCDERMAYLRSLTNPKTGFPVNGRGWTIRVTGKDPKGQWADQLGVVGNAVRIATLSADMVKDVKVPEEGKAKADVRDTGLIEVIKKPEAWGPLGGFLSAAGAIFAGSGPVQWALAALMIGGGILGFIYLVKRVRAA
ncbi:glycoside hydrolase family 108 protein [Pseudomonas monteilii]|uniref:glycoside hydrolase family 108 protein n=1 Tax=Pseudomonas monteilii TaxID=76759 RepID=UPI001378EE60|nr:glycoside hydrolase family 108 protein [Pseudomonas monteilii]NBB07839.1 secretion activator protein [Pseudomonas monteilii]